MTKMQRVQISPIISLDDAWQQLEMTGSSIAYSEEEQGHQLLHVFVKEGVTLYPYNWVEKVEDYDLPAIDWNAQWQIHGMDFNEGVVNIDLSQFSDGCETILKLEPGPGFGDLSHATTYLMLKFIPLYLQKQHVIDIGCGSGVLTLAAIAMGASQALGIDIDPQAIEHAMKNAALNHLNKQCHFILASEFPFNHVAKNDQLICMNMILSEQKIAWESMPYLHTIPAKILTSGIRVEEREIYLQQAKQWGWQLLNTIEKEGWLGFCFEQAI